jgi:hypothetical protein
MEVQPIGSARLAARSSEIDALAQESVEALDFQTTLLDAGGKDDGPRPDDFVPIQEDLVRLWVDAGD